VALSRAPRHPILPVPPRDGFFVALLAGALCAAACTGEPRAGATGSIRVTDDEGRVVRLAHPAVRILSLVPARTDILLALGAADRLIARTQFDTDPRLDSLPSLENALTPSVEWVVARNPDLVIAWPDQQSRSVVTRLIELGIPVYASRVETLAELRHSVHDLGLLVGRRAAADSIVGALDSALAAVTRSVAALPRRSVLYLVDIEPPLAAGPGTFVHELIEAAGGSNVMADAKALWPMVSVEHVLERQPAVVLIASEQRTTQATLEWLRAHAGWRDLVAVRMGDVHVLSADLFNRPGPSLIAAVGVLADAIHAERER
jgi:iron complex transport system substrate-binding protein